MLINGRLSVLDGILRTYDIAPYIQHFIMERLAYVHPTSMKERLAVQTHIAFGGLTMLDGLIIH